MSKAKDKGRLPPFVPLLVGTLDAPAWKALSHGAKIFLYRVETARAEGSQSRYVSFRRSEVRIEIEPAQD